LAAGSLGVLVGVAVGVGLRWASKAGLQARLTSPNSNRLMLKSCNGIKRI
jgi:hypothetical protein